MQIGINGEYIKVKQACCYECYNKPESKLLRKLFMSPPNRLRCPGGTCIVCGMGTNWIITVTRKIE